jgi:hypothetical protein
LFRLDFLTEPMCEDDSRGKTGQGFDVLCVGSLKAKSNNGIVERKEK